MLLPKFIKYSFLLILLMTTTSCNSVTNDSDTIGGGFPTGSENWLIPEDEVVDGGPGRDGIPSIDNPKFSPVDQIDYVENDRLVVGTNVSLRKRAYPHQVLDWHEIVNDQTNNIFFALTYCPLTGTAISWKHNADEGVSGLLFRNNLITFSRNDDTMYSQMQMRGIKGPQAGKAVDTIPVIQTTWETWKNMYPHSDVLTTETGFARVYTSSAYGDYEQEDSGTIFPVKHKDDRLLPKERVHGIIMGDPAEEDARVRTYVIDEFGSGVHLIDDQFDGKEIVIVGSTDKHFAVSFYDTINDGSRLQFEAVQDSLPIIMKDQQGNYWDIFGFAVEGPKTGARLTPTTSYTGYWFAWADFFPKPEIFQHK